MAYLKVEILLMVLMGVGRGSGGRVRSGSVVRGDRGSNGGSDSPGSCKSGPGTAVDVVMVEVVY